MKLKFDKKLVAVAVLLVLIALLFFKREGYKINETQISAIREVVIDPKDRDELLKLIKETPEGNTPSKESFIILKLSMGDPMFYTTLQNILGEK